MSSEDSNELADAYYLNYIPDSIYKNMISCLVLKNPLDVSDCSVLLYTRHQYLIEIEKKKPVRSCHTSLKDIEAMSVFYKYNEEIKKWTRYYILKNNNNLIILKRNKKEFQIIEEFNDVENFKIEDCYESGTAQVVVYESESSPHILFRLEEPKSIDSSNPNSVVNEYLNQRLQDINLHLDSLKKELYYKQCFTDRYLKEWNDSDVSELVSVLKSSDGIVINHIPKQCKPFLSIRKVTQRIFVDRLVIIIEFINTSCKYLTDVDLILSKQKFNFEYSTRLFSSINIDVDFWTSLEGFSIAPNNIGFIVASTNLLGFLKNKDCCISGKLCCEDQQYNIPEFILSARNALTIDYLCFKGIAAPDLFQNIICLLTTNIQIHLQITWHIDIDIILTDVLKGLRFIQVLCLSENSFYMDHGVLEGTFLHITSSSIGSSLVRVLARCEDHILFLMNALYDALPDDVEIKPKQLEK